MLDLSIKKSIKINPDERYQKINDLIADLENIIYKKEVKVKNEFFEKIKSIVTIPKLVMFFMIISLIFFSSIKMLQIEKKEILEIEDININVPAIPISFSFDRKAINSYDWISDRSRRDDALIQIKVKSNYTLKQSLFTIIIKNSSNDTINFFNINNPEKTIIIKDNLGNNYSSKILLNTISQELLKINPKSELEGSFILDTLADQKATKIDVRLMENNGKRRSFFVTLDKQ